MGSPVEPLKDLLGGVNELVHADGFSTEQLQAMREAASAISAYRLGNCWGGPVVALLSRRDLARLVTLLAVLLRRTMPGADGTDRERVICARLRSCIVLELQSKDTNGETIKPPKALVLALYRTGSLRCYAALLGDLQLNMETRLADCSEFLREVEALLYTLLHARGSGTPMPKDLLGLLDAWSRTVLTLTQYSLNGQLKASTTLASVGWLINELQPDLYRNAAGAVRGDHPALAYLLSSHIVGLCAALDGGSTYGLPSDSRVAGEQQELGRMPAVAPVLNESGFQFGWSIEDEDPEVLSASLATWVLAQWTKQLHAVRSALKAILGGFIADPRATRGDLPAFSPRQQALRCLQHLLGGIAAVQGATQPGGEQLGGAAAGPQAASRDEPPAAEQAQQEPEVMDPERQRNIRFLRQLLDASRTPPFKVAATYDIAMRLGICAMDELDPGVRDEVPGPPAEDAAALPAAGPSSAERQAAGAVMLQQPCPRRGTRLRGSEVLLLGLNALRCARVACWGAGELHPQMQLAQPQLLRVRRWWCVALWYVRRAALRGLLDHVWDKGGSELLQPRAPAFEASPAEPTADVASALAAGYVRTVELVLRRGANVQSILHMMNTGEPTTAGRGPWAQVLAFGPQAEVVSLAATLEKFIRAIDNALQVTRVSLAPLFDGALSGMESCRAISLAVFITRLMALTDSDWARWTTHGSSPSLEASTGSAIGGDGNEGGGGIGGGSGGNSGSGRNNHRDSGIRESGWPGAPGAVSGPVEGKDGAARAAACIPQARSEQHQASTVRSSAQHRGGASSYSSPRGSEAEGWAGGASSGPPLAFAETAAPESGDPAPRAPEAPGDAEAGSADASGPAASGPGQAGAPRGGLGAGSGTEGSAAATHAVEGCAFRVGADSPIGRYAVSQSHLYVRVAPALVPLLQHLLEVALAEPSLRGPLDAFLQQKLRSLLSVVRLLAVAAAAERAARVDCTASAGAGCTSSAGVDCTASAGGMRLAPAGAPSASSACAVQPEVPGRGLERTQLQTAAHRKGTWLHFLFGDELDLPLLLGVSLQAVKSLASPDAAELAEGLSDTISTLLQLLPFDSVVALAAVDGCGGGRDAAGSSHGARCPWTLDLSALQREVGPQGVIASPDRAAMLQSSRLAGLPAGSLPEITRSAEYEAEANRACAEALARVRPSFLPVSQLLLSPGQVRAALSTCDHPGCLNLEGNTEASLKLMSCSRCGERAYCSRNCQLTHWKAEHKQECGRRVAAAAASTTAAKASATQKQQQA